MCVLDVLNHTVVRLGILHICDDTLNALHDNGKIVCGGKVEFAASFVFLFKIMNSLYCFFTNKRGSLFIIFLLILYIYLFYMK